MDRVDIRSGVVCIGACLALWVAQTDALETVSARVQAGGDHDWTYAYDIGLRGGEVLVRVDLNLVPAGGISRFRVERARASWAEGIERVWSRRYGLRTPDGRTWPIVVEPGFRGPAFHHDVIVRPGRGHTDALDWNLNDSPLLAAHEFGHMLGVYDEYLGGAQSPDAPVLDSTSIMTSNPVRGRTYERHYVRIRDWFMQHMQAPAVIVPLDAGAGGGSRP